MVSPIISAILRDIPSLEKEYKRLILDNERKSQRISDGYLKWRMLDNRADIFLISIFGTYHRRGPILQDNIYPSQVAIVKFDDNHFHLEFLEEYNPSTQYGILNIETSHAILVRLDEYDDTTQHRYGFDDVYIINYDTHVSLSVEPFHFTEGGYHGGEIKIALNSSRNWLAFAREEYEGWLPKPKIMVYIYDLADMQLLVKSELKSIQSINSLVFSGAGQYLIVTWKGSIHRTPFHLTNKGSIHRKVF